MTREEITGVRDLTYSGWHRTLADHITYIDIDACEYCQKCREPLILIELAKDYGQSNKATTVLRKLALKANISAYLIYYKMDDKTDEIASFRLRQVSPIWGNELIMLPLEYAKFLSNIHETHQCEKTRNS